MARPHKAEEDLLHPRKLRKSTVDGPILTDKPPSVRMCLKWKPVLRRCEAMIWSQPCRADNIAKKTMVEITQKKHWRRPEGFPIGRIVAEENGSITRKYNAEKVLLWGYQYGLCERNPRIIYALRKKHLANTERFINEVLDLSDLGL